MPDTRDAVLDRTAGPQPPSPVRSRTPDDDIDLTGLVRAVSRRWAAIAAVTLLGGAIAFALASLGPVRYEASATLVVLPSDAETAGLPANAATVRALLTNTGLVDQVLRESGAGDVPAVFAAEAIAVDEVVNTRFVKVRVLALDPALAATIAGKLVDRATAQGALVDRGVAEAMMKHFDQQAGRAATRLAEAERRLLEYVREHRVEALRLEVEALLARRRAVSGSAQAPRGGTRGRDALGTPRPPAPSAPPAPIGLLFERELEVARLETDYEASRRVYADLVERREHAAAAAIGDAPIVRRLDPEIAQGRPLPRGRARKAAIGLLAGLLIGVALAVAAEARRGWRTGTA